MQLTRRNTIIAMGALAAGAGVIGGSGAFDQVEADRSFEVEVAGDASGLLGLTVRNDFIAGTEEGGAGDNDIIFFRLDDSENGNGNGNGNGGNAPALNENAETRFFEVFEIANNGSQPVEVTIDTGDADGVRFQVSADRGDNGDVVSEDTDLETDGADLNAGDTVTVDIYIDTTDGGYVEPADDNPYQMTIVAQSEDAQDQ